jgi:hypothetical protein
MITSGALRRTDDLALRWLPTGRKHAYLTARARYPNKPATITFNDARSHPMPPLPATRLRNCLKAPSARVLASPASAKSP